MTIHFLNTFTCNASFPKEWETGLLSLLIKSNQGLILVDPGLGIKEYEKPSSFMRAFGEAHPEVQLTAPHMFLDFFND